MISRKLLFLAAVASIAGFACTIRAQDAEQPAAQSESVADAARKARAQKKDSAKPAKVFTDDNLGDIHGAISVVGSDSAGDSDKSAENGGEAKPKAASAAKSEGKSQGTKDEAYWRGRFASARKALADDQRELDILQREFNLKQEQFYQDPNAALMEQYSREDLNKTQAQIDKKKQAVDNDKQALSDLEDELRHAGGEPGWADEPSGAGPSDANSGNSANASASSDSGDTSGAGSSSSTPDSEKPSDNSDSSANKPM
jgi:hypothetical protein